MAVQPQGSRRMNEEEQKMRACWDKLEDGREQEDEAKELAKLRDWNQELNEEKMDTRGQKADGKSQGIRDTTAWQKSVQKQDRKHLPKWLSKPHGKIGERNSDDAVRRSGFEEQHLQEGLRPRQKRGEKMWGQLLACYPLPGLPCLISHNRIVS
jgi:hypothetical protein